MHTALTALRVALRLLWLVLVWTVRLTRWSMLLLPQGLALFAVTRVLRRARA